MSAACTSTPSGLEGELERLRHDWEGGYFPAVIEGFKVCALNQLSLPSWLAESVHAALQFTLAKGGREGRGKTGGYYPQALRTDVDTARWNAASAALNMRSILPHFGFEATRAGAFAYAQELLAGTSAQGSPGAIEDSYNKGQRANGRTD